MIIPPGEIVIWKINSSCHDWRDSIFLGQLIDQCIALGVINDANWIKTYDDDAPKPLDTGGPSALISTLSAIISNEGEDVDFEIGGDTWALYINIYPYNSELDRVEGINTLWLKFDNAMISGSKRSEQLIRAFIELHSPTNTEYAVIHPYQHWARMSEIHYEVPITITPMFQGIFWMNYLSGGQLADFDLDKLKQIACCKLHWIDPPGLCCVTAPSLDQSSSLETERHLLELSECFRQALKEDSDWRI